MAAPHPLVSKFAINDLDNVGLKDSSTLGKFFTENSSLKQKYGGMKVNHEQFSKTVNDMKTNEILTDGAKQLNIGTVGERILDSFTTQANALKGDLQSLHSHQESQLFSNSAGLSPQQLQLLGVIGEHFMKDGQGMKYLDSTPFVEAPMTFLAKSGVLGQETGQLIIEKMDAKHSQDVLDNMAATTKAIAALDHAVEQEGYIIGYHSPAPQHMQRLRASKASDELKQVYGF